MSNCNEILLCDYNVLLLLRSHHDETIFIFTSQLNQITERRGTVIQTPKAFVYLIDAVPFIPKQRDHLLLGDRDIFHPIPGSIKHDSSGSASVSTNDFAPILFSFRISGFSGGISLNSDGL